MELWIYALLVVLEALIELGTWSILKLNSSVFDNRFEEENSKAYWLSYWKGDLE